MGSITGFSSLADAVMISIKADKYVISSIGRKELGETVLNDQERNGHFGVTLAVLALMPLALACVLPSASVGIVRR
jgi:hypothetical protein